MSAAPDHDPDDGVLDHPVLRALTGPQAGFADARGAAVRHQGGVGRFGALPVQPTTADWADLAELVGAHEAVALFDPPAPPEGWTVLRTFEAVQMVKPDPGVAEPGEGAPQVRDLGPEDLDEVLDLVTRTDPGPFGPRTMELGRYVGVHDDGRLVAMAGERLRVPGWTEVSAVCTDPDHRGRGLAALVVSAVVAGIEARGERAFLQVMAANVGAQRVYSALGFTVRRELPIRVLRPTVRLPDSPS